ncbi:MAG: GvpL/GvpF family gas vesicle protein [Beijerinckiaceae bacterium]
MSSYLYIYAIGRAGMAMPEGLPCVGNAGASLQTITIGRLAALVSVIEEPEVMMARRHMLAHTKVLEAAMAKATILPMRFGIIVDSEAAIAASVNPKAVDMLALLDTLEGRIEAGVRASWNEAVLYREIVAVRPDIGRKAEALAKLNPTAAYYDRIDLGREVDSAMAVKRFEENKILLERLKPFAVKHVSLPEGDDMNVTNVALLVDRDQEANLIAAIEAIDAEEGDRLKLKIVSPAPVYNFVKLRLEFAPPTEPLLGAA